MFLKASLFIIGALSCVRASTIVSTFGPDDSFILDGGYQIAGGYLGLPGDELAVWFTPTQDYLLENSRVAVFNASPRGGDSDLVVDLSTGLLPGTPMETFSTAVAGGGGGRIYAFNSTLHSELFGSFSHRMTLSTIVLAGISAALVLAPFWPSARRGTRSGRCSITPHRRSKCPGSQS